MLTKRAWWLLALLAATMLIGMLFQPITRISAITQDGDVLACEPIGSTRLITLAFTHSMYGGEVRETWQIDGETLIRRQIEADLAAAAEYYATDGRVERIETGFVVLASPITVESLTVRVDHIGNHRLRVSDGSTEIALASRIDETSAATTISAQRQPLLLHLIRGCRH